MRPLILVTYRDRPVHLRCFELYMADVFHDMDVAILQQADKGVWNKGLLFNAGYKELSSDYDYIIYHDIDFLPSSTVDYSYCPVPTLLATECSQFNYQHCYDKFFGGVIGMNKTHYELVNGFSNMFRGWGGEDDHIRLKFVMKGIEPQKRLGNRFENFIHPHMEVHPGGKDFNDPDYQHNLKMLSDSIDFSEGLSTAKYQVVSSNYSPHRIYLKINTLV